MADIIAPNPIFIGQSGTFPRSFVDAPEAAMSDKESQAERQIYQALTVENGVDADEYTSKIWRLFARYR